MLSKNKLLWEGLGYSQVNYHGNILIAEMCISPVTKHWSQVKPGGKLGFDRLTLADAVERCYQAAHAYQSFIDEKKVTNSDPPNNCS